MCLTQSVEKSKTVRKTELFFFREIALNWANVNSLYLYSARCRVYWNACGCMVHGPRESSASLLASKLAGSWEKRLTPDTAGSTSTARLFTSPPHCSRLLLLADGALLSSPYSQSFSSSFLRSFALQISVIVPHGMTSLTGLSLIGWRYYNLYLPAYKT